MLIAMQYGDHDWGQGPYDKYISTNGVIELHVCTRINECKYTFCLKIITYLALNEVF